MFRKIIYTVCLGLTMVVASTVAKSQDVRIKGKYKGQKIEVVATRTSQGDYVTTFKYEPYEKQEREIKTLNERVKKLDSEKKKLEEKLKKIKVGPADCDTTELSDKFKKCSGELSKAQDDLLKKQKELDSIKRSLSSLQSEVNRIKSDNKDSVEMLLSKIEKMGLVMEGKGYNRSGIGLGACIGFDIMGNSQTRGDLWSRGISSAQQFELTYTHYFSETKPVAIKFGVGFSMCRGKASFSRLEDTVAGLSDIDGDIYDGRFIYTNVLEKADVKYVDIPLLLHVGNDYDYVPVQGWFEAGLRMSFKVASSITGEGKYSLKGYYPAWGVEMSDVSELGYVTNKDLYASDPEYSMNTVVLWGQLAAGIYVPMGKYFGLNLGARCGYSLTPISKSQQAEDGRNYCFGQMNIVNGGKTRVLTVGVEVGITYQFGNNGSRRKK